MRTSLRVLTVVALLAPGPVLAAPDIQTPILAAHNAERSRAGVADLTWSDRLADHAALWAAQLAATGRLDHSPIKSRPGEGENLWLGTAGAYSPAEMVDSWAEERMYFRNGKFPDVTDLGDWHAVGHYTQMVWKHTSEVGCAIAHSGRWDVLVCRYAPAGNTIGKHPF